MDNHRITIESQALNTILADGQHAFPNECCGFMYGIETADNRIISKAIPVDNSKEGDQRRRFEISPLDYMRAERYALENNLLLLGVYHSHPNHPAIASIHDLAKAMPYFSYVIVSVMEGEINHIRSWRLKDNERKFTEETIQYAELKIAV